MRQCLALCWWWYACASDGAIALFKRIAFAVTEGGQGAQCAPGVGDQQRDLWFLVAGVLVVTQLEWARPGDSCGQVGGG